MWLSAAIVVVLFLAFVSSLIVLSYHWSGVRAGWESSLERARSGTWIEPRPMVRTDTDQAQSDRTDISFEQVADYLAHHNLTDEQLIILYARAHRTPDDYPLSANKIRDAVGGSRDEVLAAIAAQRPKPKAQSPRRLERPANGW